MVTIGRHTLSAGEETAVPVQLLPAKNVTVAGAQLAVLPQVHAEHERVSVIPVPVRCPIGHPVGHAATPVLPTDR